MFFYCCHGNIYAFFILVAEVKDALPKEFPQCNTHRIFNNSRSVYAIIFSWNYTWGLPFSTYAPSGVGEVKPSIHFHCVLHAKKGWVGPDRM